MRKIVLSIFKVYLFTWLFAFLFFSYNVYSSSTSWSKIFASFFEIAFSLGGLITVHIIFLFFFVFFLIFRYFVSVYKKRGIKIALIRFTIRFLLPTLLIVFSFTYIISKNNQEDYTYAWNYAAENTSEKSKKSFLVDEKIRGMSVYQIGRNRNVNISELIKTNIEWVAVIPYFYQKDENTKNINTPKEVGIWSKRDSSFIRDIKKLHQKELYVMIKPHLWMSSGWRSNIHFKNSEDWDSWFSDYRKIMMHYAYMAEETNTELLCIGTELRNALQEQPNQWLQLLKEIRAIYTGKITYAANWDDSLDFPAFWTALDYIGIQAYFPLTKNKNPNLQDIKKGWNPHIEKLKTLSEKYSKPILFTEVGYRDDLSATIKPWEWESSFKRLYKKKSDRTQQLAYEALFEELWDKPWFAGVFPWEWTSSDFPIYKKPAQNTITIWYNK
ncbi:hypothetical protein RQM59_11575 [Flavobacteriaceae bacterium S356]|uniref:Glycoside hydrolase n=1 Tax=Asprobacillus argus TaxID=3076534 RepID=A0ABU3LHA5_9FLAO|nr:hypothetical protein [Flavobacteriaceae bacterium S356]